MLAGSEIFSLRLPEVPFPVTYGIRREDPCRALFLNAVSTFDTMPPHVGKVD
jgi:hypothetical protein